VNETLSHASDQVETKTPSPRFAVLGPVRAWRGTAELNLGTRQQRQVLALLLVRSGRFIMIHEFVELLWGSSAPASSTNSVHRFIGSLRRILEPDLPMRSDGHWLLRRDGAYSLELPEGGLDLTEFRQIAKQAREAEALGLADVAIARYAEALHLWQGRCADDGTSETLRHSAFVAVDEEYAAVARDAARGALKLDGVDLLLPAVRQAAERHPLDEALQARMMSLLAADGRQADAFALFQKVRDALSRELGVKPGTELRRAYDEVLQPHEPAAPPAATARLIPAQLPRDLPLFTGRGKELARATQLLRKAEQAESMPIIAIDGMPGAGKSTFAVHWAYEVANQFPDGQLYLDLRGHRLDADPVTAQEALESLLATLGTGPDDLPAIRSTRAALLRSQLAGRRILLLLDNAESVEQVRDLLPGGNDCLVIITSRARLTALNAREGAEPFTLEPLSHEDARTLLTRRFAGKVDQTDQGNSREALDALVDICGHLPLALVALSAHISLCSRANLSAIVAELRRRDSQLDLFREDGVVNVRESFAASYRGLDAPTARIFRLMALHAGANISTAAAVGLWGLSLPDVRPLLVGLSRSHLLQVTPDERLALHPLMRRYASELSAEIDDDAHRRAAEARLFQHYRHTAYTTHQILGPLLVPIAPGDLLDGVTPETITGYDEAMSWFRAEITILEELVERSSELGAGADGWQLATTMMPFYQRSGLTQGWLATMRNGLRSAEHIADRAGQAHMYRCLAGAYHQLGDQDQAQDNLRWAQRLFAELGLVAEQAYVHKNLATVLAWNSQYREAIAEFEQGRQLFAAANHQKGVAAATEGIASCLARLGDHDAALRLFEGATTIYLSIGDRNGIADCLRGSGDLWRRSGDNDTAVDHLRRSIALYREVGNRADEAEALIWLGDALSGPPG
jgi:DNA-binding SARP family transcriptional activator/tetratricopeptide (TPR) repeat protein